MDKKEFTYTDQPLVMIVSLNPKTGKVMYDTYHPDTVASYMEDFERDFPDHIHFQKTNQAGIKLRRERFGIE